MSLLALKIVDIRGTTLVFDDPRYGPMEFPSHWLALHEPEIGGFYIVDDDGRNGFSLTLPEDVPAPVPFLATPPPRAETHPDDHFRYDWLEACLKVLAAQLDGVQASLDTLTTKEKTDA